METSLIGGTVLFTSQKHLDHPLPLTLDHPLSLVHPLTLTFNHPLTLA